MSKKVSAKTIAQQIADAAIKIGRANHYLIGFDSEWAASLSYDDCMDARQLLITAENGGRKMAAAFHVLDTYIARNHGVRQ